MNNLYRPERHHKKKAPHVHEERNVTVDLSNKTLLRKYVSFLRKQDTHTQRVHAFALSGIATAVLALLWLHFFYGFWQFGTRAYDSSVVYEEKVLTENASSTPHRNPFVELFEETLTVFKNMHLNTKGIFSETQTFERKDNQ